MANLVATQVSDKRSLKVDNQDASRLNVVMEEHTVATAGTGSSLPITTSLKTVLGYIISQTGGTAVALVHISTLVVTAGVLTITIQSTPASGGSTVPADLASNVTLKVILFGLSY